MMRKTHAAVAVFCTLGVTAFWVEGSAQRQREFAGPMAVSASMRGSQKDNCLACHQQIDPAAIALFQSSTHGRLGEACSSCHNGDPAAAVKSAAHSGRFLGQPQGKEVLTMCGGCHTNPLSEFKLGRHFKENQAPRVGCVECHGAHSVGSRSRNFSFAYYCAGCHGLEYLPPLPDGLQKMLSMSDDLNDRIREIESSGRKLSLNAINMKREVRRRIAGIVHPTDLKGSLESAPEVTERIRALIDLVAREKR